MKREKKTPYSTPNIVEIQTQITKYREFIAEDIEKSTSSIKVIRTQDIKAYYICGKDSYAKLNVRNLQSLREAKIEVMTYQDIIRQAEKVYSDRVKS